MTVWSFVSDLSINPLVRCHTEQLTEMIGLTCATPPTHCRPCAGERNSNSTCGILAIS